MHPSFVLGKALDYIAALQEPASGIPATPVLEGTDASDLQPDLGPAAGGLVALLVHLVRPQRILEIGTAIGTTALLLGREAASFGGRVVSLEIRAELAEIALRNISRAGLQGVVEVTCADARVWVGEAAARGAVFDLILQDGGKESYLPMLPDLIALLSDRGILVTDDVLFPVMDLPERVRPWQEAVAAYNRALAGRRDLRTVWLPVGDGLAISIKSPAAPGSVFPGQERGGRAPAGGC